MELRPFARALSGCPASPRFLLSERSGERAKNAGDGIISLDRLGLEKVYIQAKRWKKTNPVGSPEIQAFMGALQLQGATKRVLITTSAFTEQAKVAAAKARGSIVLVDGAQLTNRNPSTSGVLTCLVGARRIV